MTQPRKHLTDRSRVMMPVGALWVLVGYGILTGNPLVMSGAPHAMLLGTLWGAVWIATGVIGIAAAVTRVCKDIAVALLNVMPVIRATSYALSVVLSQVPPVGNHVDRGSVGQFLLAMIAAWLVWAIAKIDHPTPVYLTEEHTR